VGHHHFALFDGECLDVVESEAQFASVNVAAYGTYGTMFCQSVYDKLAADVSGMPYLVTVVEMDEVFVVPPCVGVGHQPYAFHNPKRCFM
jgi:hypothetical protein